MTEFLSQRIERGAVGWKLYLAMKIQNELESKELNGFEMNLNKSSK